MDNNDVLKSLRGMAAYLKLPTEWLKTEAIAGRIPCLKIGKRFFFNAIAVRSALAEMAAKEVAHD